MELQETYQLTKWIRENIEEAQVDQKYDALIAVLTANARRQNNQPAQPFEDEKNNLVKSLTTINLNVLNIAQIQALEILGIFQNIGDLGERALEELLSDTLDIAHVVNQVTEMKNTLQEGITKSNQLSTALEVLIEEEEPLLSTSQILTRVMFEEDAAVNNIVDLKDWASKWFDIGRGFAIANGQAPEDIQVIGGARGTLIVELALLATTALPIAKAINMILDSMVKFKECQLKAIEVRRLKEDIPKMADEFEEDAKRWEDRVQRLKTDIVEEVSEEIKNHLPNLKKENHPEYEKAIKNLVDFTLKGGEVDCVFPEEDEDVENEDEDKETPQEVIEAIRTLKADFSRIRTLKENLLLEHHREEDDE